MAVFQECFVLPEKGFMASCRSCQHANSRNRRASSLGGRQDRGGGAGRARPIVSRPASRANYHSVGSGNYDQLKGRDVGSCARCSLSFRSIADSARFMAMPGRLVFTRPCVSSLPIRNWKRYRSGSSVGPITKATPLCIMRRLGGMPKAYPDSETTKTRYAVETGPGCSGYDTPRRIAAAEEGGHAHDCARRTSAQVSIPGDRTALT